MFERILIATDGSDHSKKAAKKRVDMAKFAGGEVTALHVVDSNRTLSGVSANRPRWPRSRQRRGSWRATPPG